MIFRIIFLLFIFTLNAHAKEKLAILCSDYVLKKSLIKCLKNNYKIVNNLEKADIIICNGENFLNKCLKYNKKMILTGIYRYEFEKLKNKENILAVFPMDYSIQEINSFLKKKFKNFSRCIITHYLNDRGFKDLKIFKINSFNELPFVLDKALKLCDLIISIPDDFVFNYFSTRFIFKKVLLSGKLITGFSKSMLDLGAVYIFEIDKKKYFEKITKILKNFNVNELEAKTYILYPNLNEFKIYKNQKILNDLK